MKFIKRLFVFLSISLFLFVSPIYSNPKYQEIGLELVKMETSFGDIYLKLYEDRAPKTVQNFLKYVDSQFYDGLIFHRVIDGFMIQGGGFSKLMTQKTTMSPIKNEANNNVKNLRGTISMARTGDPHSATAQFFINVKDNDFLNYVSPSNYGYAVFGEVVSGMDVVDMIKSVETGTVKRFSDVPLQPITMDVVKRVKLYERLTP
ncbi:hypothetical protein DID75_01665 [Candidatus Marinamargulisbacteria bacterium SCGC AG-410-N11]|nr:hypothetical protein DID75_01665 [Candidatus Marinamargulisbacteria bacterium SCGC AG-410-N11]